MWRARPASESACLDWSRSEMVDAPMRKSGRTTFRWDMLLRPGPFDWRAVAPLRAVRVAVGVIVPLACATQVVGAEGRSRTLRPRGCRSPAETPPQPCWAPPTDSGTPRVVDRRLRSAPDGCMLCSAGPLAHVVVLAAEKLSHGAIALAAKQLRRSRRADAAPPGRKRSSAARASRLIWIIASSPMQSSDAAPARDQSSRAQRRTPTLATGRRRERAATR
jgi:hypothetical protein